MYDGPEDGQVATRNVCKDFAYRINVDLLLHTRENATRILQVVSFITI